MTRKPLSVSVVGLGYVGLCTATAFALKGFKTIGVDVDKDRSKKSQLGKVPFHEPGLERILKRVVKMKSFEATNDVSRSGEANVTFIAVGTPMQPNGSIDLTHVRQATSEIASALKKKSSYHLVAVKSTVIPGTTRSVVKPLLEAGSDKPIGEHLGLCVNPEFLKEGSAVHDALHPDKLVIGSLDKKSNQNLLQVYRQFFKRNLPPTICTTPETAELVKYANNAFLATKISFINSIANICERIPGVDVEVIAKTIGLDPRIGSLFLKAGAGYGGSCLHKDLQALMSFGVSQGYDPILLRATEKVNQAQAERVVELAEKLMGSFEGKRVAILGLAFKKDTDDVREAASIRIIKQLKEKGSRIVAYDPRAITNAARQIGDKVEFARDIRSAITGADCTIVVTEWQEFKRLRVRDYLALAKSPNLVDARRIYDPREYSALNFAAVGLGPFRGSDIRTLLVSGRDAFRHESKGGFAFG